MGLREIAELVIGLPLGACTLHIPRDGRYSCLSTNTNAKDSGRGFRGVLVEDAAEQVSVHLPTGITTDIAINGDKKIHFVDRRNKEVQKADVLVRVGSETPIILREPGEEAEVPGFPRVTVVYHGSTDNREKKYPNIGDGQFEYYPIDAHGT